MSRSLRFMALVSLLVTALLQAQNASIYGSVLGSVTDSSGAAAPGIRVSVTNVDTGITTSGASNSVGYYRIDGLIAGTYRVAAEGAGFKKYVKDGIALS